MAAQVEELPSWTAEVEAPEATPLLESAAAHGAGALGAAAGEALGEALAREFGLTHLFIDCDNPV